MSLVIVSIQHTRPLSELLDQLGEALESDLHWATDTPYTHPEFLHEVFQRYMLNFIFEKMGIKEFHEAGQG